MNNFEIIERIPSEREYNDFRNAVGWHQIAPERAAKGLEASLYGICIETENKLAAFGRVISEVGISMMLGGNAKGFTRTMTTAMALEYDKGEFVLAVALGVVLLTLAFGINLMFHFVQGRAEQ